MNNDSGKKTKNEIDFERGTREIDKSKSRASKKAIEEQHEAFLAEQEKAEFEMLIKQASKKSAASSKSQSRVLNNFAYRKDIAQIFRRMNQSNGIHYNRYITIRFNSINYSHRNSGESSLNALETSLIHSSRKEKRLVEEWIENQSHNNIYYAGGKYLSHEDFVRDRDQYLSFFDRIMETANNKHDLAHKQKLSKYSRYRSSYFCKIKKLLPELHPDHAKFVEKVSKLESASNKTINLNTEPHSVSIDRLRLYLGQQFEHLGYSPKHSQNKLRVFDNYLSHRSKHQELKASTANRKVKSRNSTCISEAVVKIPQKYGEFKEVDKQQMLETCIKFFNDNFDVKVRLASFHADEGLNEAQETGLNVHVFIEPNSNISWSQQYVGFAKEQAKKNYPNIFSELISIDPSKKLSPQVLIGCGQILQLSLVQELQEKIFNSHGIGIRFLEENERKEFNNIQAMVEQQLPLHQRVQSRYNMLNDKSNELSQSIALQSKQLEAINSATEKKQKEMLEAICIWKLQPTPETASLTLFQLEMIDELPDAIKTSLLAEITSFEQRNNIDSNAKLSNKMSKP